MDTIVLQAVTYEKGVREGIIRFTLCPGPHVDLLKKIWYAQFKPGFNQSKI